MIPKSSWPNFDNKLINQVTKILKSGKTNYLIGSHGKNFERNFSKYFNIKYSNSISNATIGLELALLSLNLEKNDEILVTPRSYHSSVSCVERIGLKPVFVDIDKVSMNICPKSIIKNISSKTKALICVHLYGLPCDMKNIMNITRKYKLKLIEDCSQAHGAKIGKKFVGSFGDVSVFSFCQDKIMSTGGEGAMICTNQKKIYEKIWSLKDIGKNKKKYENINKNLNKFPYVHDHIGTNARLTEIQSCIGNYQLKFLRSHIKKRNINANIYYRRLKSIKSLTLPSYDRNITHSYYRYTIILNNNRISRDKLMQKLKEENIYCNVGGCPAIYLEKYFKHKYKIAKKNLKNTESIKNKTISFLVDQTISEKDINKACDVLINEIAIYEK